MCDYSLEAYRTRPAREGERYVTTRFASGSIGLAAPGDPSIPVCVPCDTAVRLVALPAELRGRPGLNAPQGGTFVPLHHWTWRGGVRFRHVAVRSPPGLPTGIRVNGAAPP